jgi:membrane protein DedA with SNARE-associated domain
MHKILTLLFDLAVSLVTKLGYGGIFLGMTIESASIPLPSEAIMGFAGYLISQGKFGFWQATLFGALGNALGSTIMYALGKYGGNPFLERYGKWFRISKKELDKAEVWFQRYGDGAVFIAQLLPVIRTFISFPAGVLEISYKKFIFYTFTGAFIWCGALVYMGKKLGENWENLSHYLKPVQNVMIVLVAALVAYFIYSHFIKKSRKAKAQ